MTPQLYIGVCRTGNTDVRQVVYSGNPDSKIETSWVRSLSLVVASFTLSHVIAIVLKAGTAHDVNLSSISCEHDSSGSSSQRIPAKIGCIVGSNGKKLVGFLIVAMSSGSGSRSGFVEPVG